MACSPRACSRGRSLASRFCLEIMRFLGYQQKIALSSFFLFFFRFFSLRRATTSGERRVAPLAPRTQSRVRAPVPTAAAPRPSEGRTFQHPPKLGRVHLNVSSPARRFRCEGER